MSVASSGMYPVAAIPEVKLNGGGNMNTNLAGIIKVSATGNTIRLLNLPLSFKSVGSYISIATGTTVTIKDSTGTTLGTGIVATSSNTATTVVSLTTSDAAGYKINGGSYAMLYVYPNITLTGGDVATQKVQTSLGSNTLFTWKDVEGGATITTSANLLKANYDVDSAMEVLN